MQTEVFDQPAVVINSEADCWEDEDTGNDLPCGIPVANTTFEFGIQFPNVLASTLIAKREDEIDHATILERRAEPVESMEKVFGDLGIA